MWVHTWSAAIFGGVEELVCCRGVFMMINIIKILGPEKLLKIPNFRFNSSPLNTKSKCLVTCVSSIITALLHFNTHLIFCMNLQIHALLH
ncbi:MAG: hypothetical protein JWR38_4377 [Mucilaginibacter sp.]|nr:hypothetical protein [Mucilaginibacter sp.]